VKKFVDTWDELDHEYNVEETLIAIFEALPYKAQLEVANKLGFDINA
jgi:hypothetical protein